MIVQREQSKIKKIFGLVIGTSFTLGIIGLGIILVTGFTNTQMYWNSLWIFMGLLSVGLIGARIHNLIWGKR